MSAKIYVTFLTTIRYCQQFHCMDYMSAETRRNRGNWSSPKKSAIFWTVTPCSSANTAFSLYVTPLPESCLPYSWNLKMETTCSPETLRSPKTTRRYNPKTILLRVRALTISKSAGSLFSYHMSCLHIFTIVTWDLFVLFYLYLFCPQVAQITRT
jgi:hypothetical protein